MRLCRTADGTIFKVVLCGAAVVSSMCWHLWPHLALLALRADTITVIAPMK
jgi:hypothetical protein